MHYFQKLIFLNIVIKLTFGRLNVKLTKDEILDVFKEIKKFFAFQLVTISKTY